MFLAPAMQLARMRRVALAVLVTVAVLLMCGVTAQMSGDLGASTSSTSSMPGMASMVDEPGLEAASTAPTGSGLPAQAVSLLPCAGECGSAVAHACLVVLTVAGTVLAATASLRWMDQDRAPGGRSVLASLAVLLAVPPWSVLSLAQLSCLRV